MGIYSGQCVEAACVGKAYFSSYRVAERAAARINKYQDRAEACGPYRCQYCNRLHLGRVDMDLPKVKPKHKPPRLRFLEDEPSL